MAYCLSCDNKLVYVSRDAWSGACPYVKSAPSSDLNIDMHHEAYVCFHCFSIHIYCNDCDNGVKLVERSRCIDYNDNCTLVSWRDEKWQYHCVDVNDVLLSNLEKFACEAIKKITGYDKEFIVSYLFYYEPGGEFDEFDEFDKVYGQEIRDMFFDMYGKTVEELYELIYDDLVNDVNDRYKYRMDDLNLYRFDPNDLRLSHKKGRRNWILWTRI